jgi:Flp pilus assembly pilin Flp
MFSLVLLQTVTAEEVTPALNTAKAISEYGVLVVIAAFMLIAMFLLFRHFLKMFEEMFNKVSSSYASVETPMEQIRVLQSVMFDLAKYNLMDHLERIFYEDYLEDRNTVEQKVQDVCITMFQDRKSKFDNFKYHGYSLSDFCDKSWVNKMKEIGMRHLYLQEGQFDIKQAFAAIDLAYNQIKIEFYNNLISKS